MECLECQCSNLIDVEDTSEGDKNYMCEDCGAEQSDINWKFRKYKVGKIVSVEELKPPLKKCIVKISGDKNDEPLQIVTNAKHVAKDDTVVVATIGAIVPAGSDSDLIVLIVMLHLIVKAAAVGGTKSNGMLCDGFMLQWAGGSKGVLVKLNADEYEIGSTPPARKPMSS